MKLKLIGWSDRGHLSNVCDFSFYVTLHGDSRPPPPDRWEADCVKWTQLVEVDRQESIHQEPDQNIWIRWSPTSLFTSSPCNASLKRQRPDWTLSCQHSCFHEDHISHQPRCFPHKELVLTRTPSYIWGRELRRRQMYKKSVAPSLIQDLKTQRSNQPGPKIRGKKSSEIEILSH